MLLAGCSKDADISNSTTLSGNGEKTPLLINATLDTGKGLTRAYDDTFEANDKLKVYFRHTIDDGEGGYDLATAGLAQSLVTINVQTGGTTPGLAPIYWDDFSNSASSETDLRTTSPQHALQSYYAYCYNGNTAISNPADLTNGNLTWAVNEDQETNLTTTSDLLWSTTQAPVAYNHNEIPVFNIPFSHAMCQVTVTLKAAKGFRPETGYTGVTNPLGSTRVLLYNVNTETLLKPTLAIPTFAPTIQTAPAKIQNIKMCRGTYPNTDIDENDRPYTRDFTAIIAPGTKLKEGVKLLDIIDANDNNYEVYITGVMLDTNHWASGHAVGQYGNLDGDGKNCVITQQGKNYHLEVTIDKSAVETAATLAPWSTVEAAGTGDIQFDNMDTGLTMNDSFVPDLNDTDIMVIDDNGFANEATFSLFRSNATTNPTSRDNSKYDFCAVSEFHNTDETIANDKWTNSPEVYWPNKTDNYYFRALAKLNNITAGVIDIQSVGSYPSDKGTSISLSNDWDILWGTTAAHNGTSSRTYARGAAIPPRTGGVPIVFKYVNRSKVFINLETTNDAAAVDLTGATISVTNLYTEGTINLEDGSITGTTLNLEPAGASAAIPTDEYPIEERYVLAQTIRDDAVVTITLADNAGVYTIPLKDCVKSGGTTPITVWEGGHTYNYTIHVKKEDVRFSAVVKPWATVTGSGTASLSWE